MLVIIGGTGLDQLHGFNVTRVVEVTTPYATTPVKLAVGCLTGCEGELAFIPRHGEGHTVPPHRINYRANIDALRRAGAGAVLAVNAVGGIHSRMGPGVIAIPSQIIDYTYGREHTFFDGIDVFAGQEATASAEQISAFVTHIDFTEPYDPGLRALLISSAADLDIPVCADGIYGATQGPRLETPAEIRRMQQDGCDMVGMTGMPEAALAREAGVPYASIALSVNWGAGLSDDVITMDNIRPVLEQGMNDIRKVLAQAVRRYNNAAASSGSGGTV